MQSNKNRNSSQQGRRHGRQKPWWKALRAPLAALMALLLVGALALEYSGVSRAAGEDEFELTDIPELVDGGRAPSKTDADPQPEVVTDVNPDAAQQPAEPPADVVVPPPVIDYDSFQDAQPPEGENGPGGDIQPPVNENGGGGDTQPPASEPTQPTQPPAPEPEPLRLTAWESATQLAWDVAYDTGLADVGLPNTLRAITSTGDTVKVPVRWMSKTAYSGQEPGVYVFTAYAKDKADSTYWKKLTENLPLMQRTVTVMAQDVTPENEAAQPGGTHWEEEIEADTPAPIPPENPADEGSGEPVDEPTGEPVDQPTGEGSGEPTGEPVDQPTGEGSGEPTGEPVDEGSGEPSGEPVGEPTGEGSGEPSGEPTGPSEDEPAGDGTVIDAAGNVVNAITEPGQEDDEPLVLTPYVPSEPVYIPEEGTGEQEGGEENTEGEPTEEPVEGGEIIEGEAVPEGEEVSEGGEVIEGGEIIEGEENPGEANEAGFWWVIGVTPLDSDEASEQAAPGAEVSSLGLPGSLEVVLSTPVVAAKGEGDTPEEPQDTAQTKDVAVRWNASPSYNAQEWSSYQAARDDILAQAQLMVAEAAPVTEEEADAANEAILTYVAEAEKALSAPPTSYDFTPVFEAPYVPVDGLPLPTVHVDIQLDETDTSSLQVKAMGDTFTVGPDTFRVTDSSTSPEGVTVVSSTATGTHVVQGTVTNPATGRSYRVYAFAGGACPGITSTTISRNITQIGAGAFPALSSLGSYMTSVAGVASSAFPADVRLRCPANMVFAYQKLGINASGITAKEPYDTLLTATPGAPTQGVPFTVNLTMDCAYDNDLDLTMLQVTNGTVNSVAYTPYVFSSGTASTGPMTGTAYFTVTPAAAGPMTVTLPKNAIKPKFYGVGNAAAKLELTVLPSTVSITGTTVNPGTLPSTGGAVVIGITGNNLNKLSSLDVRGFGANPTPVAIQNANYATATIVLPANTGATPVVYELQIWANGGDTGLRLAVTVQPMTLGYIDCIKADRYTLYRGGGKVKITIYGEYLNLYSSLVIKTNGEYPVYADIVKDTHNTRAVAYVSLPKNTSKGTEYYDLRLWVNGTRTEHAVEVKVRNYYYKDDSGGSGSSTPATTYTQEYNKLYQYDAAGVLRSATDLNQYLVNAEGAMEVPVLASTAAASYQVSLKELDTRAVADLGGEGYLELSSTSYRLRIPFRALRQPVLAADGVTITGYELLPNIQAYLKQTKRQEDKLWLQATLAPVTGGGYQVTLSLLYQERASTTNLKSQPLTTATPVVLEGLYYPLEIGAPVEDAWQPITQSGTYTDPFVNKDSSPGAAG